MVREPAPVPAPWLFPRPALLPPDPAAVPLTPSTQTQKPFKQEQLI